MAKLKVLKILEEYRLEHRLSQEKIAEKLGVTKEIYNKWVNGKGNPGMISLFQIEKFIKENCN